MNTQVCCAEGGIIIFDAIDMPVDASEGSDVSIVMVELSSVRSDRNRAQSWCRKVIRDIVGVVLKAVQMGNWKIVWRHNEI